MTCPPHRPATHPPGCMAGLFPALLTTNAGAVAAWHWLFGNPDVAIWACWAMLAAGYATYAARTIAVQRAELQVLRRATRSSP